MENGPKIRAEMDSLSPSDVMKEIGRRWSELTDKEKEKYKALEEEDKDR